LSDKQVQNAKPDPGKRITSLFDGGGLYLEIHAGGAKRWRMKYRHSGKNRLLTFGTYPDVTLTAARERREEARKLIAAGLDPITEKREGKVIQAARQKAEQEEESNTLLKVAEGWREVWKTHVSPQTAKEIWANLERNIFPDLGALPIAKVTTKVLLDCLRRIEATGRGAQSMALRRRNGQAVQSLPSDAPKGTGEGEMRFKRRGTACRARPWGARVSRPRRRRAGRPRSQGSFTTNE
jgi:hypothetical protein